MAFKLISILMFFVVLHEITSQAVNPNCWSQIQQLQAEISLATRESRLQVSSARIAIQSQGSLARINIKTEIAALQSRIQQAVGPTTPLCRITAKTALGKLNLGLNECYRNIELNQLDMQVSQISALKAGASQICAICAGLSECVNGKIKEVKSQIDDIQAQVVAKAADIAGGNAECFQNAQAVQIGIINNISNDFDACL